VVLNEGKKVVLEIRGSQEEEGGDLLRGRDGERGWGFLRRAAQILLHINKPAKKKK